MKLIFYYNRLNNYKRLIFVVELVTRKFSQGRRLQNRITVFCYFNQHKKRQSTNDLKILISEGEVTVKEIST